METVFMDLISALGVVAGSFGLEFLKSKTGALDGKIGNAIRPAQPILVGLAGIGLPYLTNALGISAVDPTVFVTAPTATIAVVSMREAMKRLNKPAEPTG